MAFPLDFTQSLKQQADIVRIVGDYLTLKKAGAQNYSGLCPFHKEKTPSFSVHATRQFYHCFGCGVSGDVFAFVAKIENISFPEAVRLVAQKLGVPIPRQKFQTEQEARDAGLRTALLEIHERACAFFEEYLRRPEGARARQYLVGRGLDEASTAQFRLGFAPDSGFLLRDRLRTEFSEEVLRESGLFSWKQDSASRPNETRSSHPGPPPAALAPSDEGHTQTIAGVAAKGLGEGRAAPLSAMYSKFRNRVMFPIRNVNGQVIAFTGRTLATDEKSGPKYLNSPETAIYSKSRVLFNLDQAKDAIRALQYAILVEGQMDCLSLYAAGFRNVIASSGTAFTAAQAALLARFAKQAVVNFDPDAAGAKATERTLGLLVEEEFDIRVLTLEPGFDPDLFVRRKGKQAYAAALKSSQRYFEYLIERARAQFPVRSAEGKAKAVNYLLPHIQRVPSRIVRDEVAEEVAQKLSIDSAVLRQDLKNAAVTRKTTAVAISGEAQVRDAEKILICALASATKLNHTSGPCHREDSFALCRQVRDVLASERLHAGLGTESLFDALLSSPSGAGDVLQLSLGDDERRLLASILMKEDAEELTEQKIEGALRALRRVQIRRRLEQIQIQIASARNLDSETLHGLMEEKLQLKRVLIQLSQDQMGMASGE